MHATHILSFTRAKEHKSYVLIAMSRISDWIRVLSIHYTYHEYVGFDITNGSSAESTWLGMTKNGRIGLLTNYRQGEKFLKHDAKRRGELIPGFLKSHDSPYGYLEKVKERGEDYNGFNLIVADIFSGDLGQMEFGYYCNKEDGHPESLKPGVYAVSNRYLDYEWKKVSLGKKRFEEIVKREQSVMDKVNLLLEMLQDETKYVANNWSQKCLGAGCIKLLTIFEPSFCSQMAVYSATGDSPINPKSISDLYTVIQILPDLHNLFFGNNFA